MGTSVSTDRQGEAVCCDGWMIFHLGQLEALLADEPHLMEMLKTCTTTEKSYTGDYSITKGFLCKIIHHRVSLNSIFPLCI